jgi:glycosyltransferase involved in cell wall biosynthesis
MNLSIVIPAYNEEERISNTLKRYVVFFRGKKASGKISSFEIVVVLNACTDGTLEIVKGAMGKYSEVRFLNFVEGGKGFAVTEGFRDALVRKNDLIGFIDADLATQPEAFYVLVEKIGKYDGIIASRWMSDSVIKSRQPLLRRFMSRSFNFIIRAALFLPFRDTQCGAKLFRREAVKEVVDKIGEPQWAFDVNLLYIMKKRGFKVLEVGTVWEDQEGSKLNVTKVPIQMFLAIVRLRLIYSPFRFVVRAYNNFLGGIKIYNI